MQLNKFVSILLLFSGCVGPKTLDQVSLPDPGPPNHPLYSYHELQYLSCDCRRGVKPNPEDTNPRPEIIDDSTSSVFTLSEKHLDIASKTWLYAIMASNAYRKEGRVYIIPGWEFKRRSVSKTGLAIEEWSRTNSDNQIEEIVVAFEGTNFKSMSDWGTNFSFGEPRQYQEAMNYMQGVLKRSCGARIVATGHSLGGAIALNVSLRIPGIDYRGFDSSPRGFHRIKKKDYNNADRIFIYEKGEILSFIRVPWFMKLNNFKERYWYNFMDFTVFGSSIEEHDMYLISRGLLMAAIKNGDSHAGTTFTANFNNKNLDVEFQNFKHLNRKKQLHEIAVDIEECKSKFQRFPINNP